MTAREAPARCVCGCLVTAHHLTDSGRRTWCTTGTQAGPCGCTQYQRREAAS